MYENSCVISIVNQKGGSGKSTLAINLASCLARDGFEVLLVDSDIQGSAIVWDSVAGEEDVSVVSISGSSLPKTVESMRKNYGFIVIDGTSKTDKLAALAIKCSDLVLLPVTPSPLDVWSVEDTVGLIKDRQQITDGFPKAFFVVSRVVKNTNISKEVVEALEEMNLPVLRTRTTYRVAYGDSLKHGKSVFSYKQRTNSCRWEIIDIKNEVLNIIDGNS